MYILCIHGWHAARPAPRPWYGAPFGGEGALRPVRTGNHMTACHAYMKAYVHAYNHTSILRCAYIHATCNHTRMPCMRATRATIPPNHRGREACIHGTPNTVATTSQQTTGGGVIPVKSQGNHPHGEREPTSDQSYIHIYIYIYIYAISYILYSCKS